MQYEAPESLVNGSILICFTSLPKVTEYSVVFGWNFGVSFPGEIDSFSRSALSMLPCRRCSKENLVWGPGIFDKDYPINHAISSNRILRDNPSLISRDTK